MKITFRGRDVTWLAVFAAIFGAMLLLALAFRFGLHTSPLPMSFTNGGI